MSPSDVVITRRAIRVRLAEAAMLHVQGVSPCQTYPGMFRLRANQLADCSPARLVIPGEVTRVYEELIEQAEQAGLFDLPGYRIEGPAY